MRSLFCLVIATLVGTCSSAPPLLQQIQDLGELRVVTRNTPTTYFTGPDGPAGPEYDLVKGLADRLGVQLKVATVDNVSEIVPQIVSGKAHMAAAGLSMTASRRQYLSFGHPYNSVDMHLIYKLGNSRPRTIDAIAGMKIEVVASSSHSDMMASLSEVYPGIEWTENADVEVDDLLAKVAEGKIDLTIADSTEFNIQRHFYPELRVALDLAVGDAIAWAYKDNDGDSLLKVADEFLIDAGRSGVVEQVLDRYFGHMQKFDYAGTRAFVRHYDVRLPRYQKMFEEAAAAHGVDWRLLAAIGYQESHWRSHAVSPTGVRGIMMLTEATADYLDIDDRMDPESSIFGGAEYFSRQIERLPDSVEDPDRMWLALASYNVGFYHVKDAQQIVEWSGGNPNKWIDVSKALPLLAKQKWYSRVPYGYARGWEPVLYVNNIRSYYNIIRWITGDEKKDKADQEMTRTPALMEIAQLAESSGSFFGEK